MPDCVEAPGPRVLIASNVFPPEVVGGAELVAHRQAVALARRGFEITVLAASARAADRLTIAEERMDGLRVFRVGLPEMRQLDSFHLPRIEALARSIMGLVRPDAVHCHNLPGLGVALVPIAKAAGARVVVTLHDTWGFCLRQTRLRDGNVLCTNFTECDLCLPQIPAGLGEPLPVRLRRDYVRWCLEQADDFVFPSTSLRHSYAHAGLSAPDAHTWSNGSNSIPSPRGSANPGPSWLCCRLARLGSTRASRYCGMHWRFCSLTPD